MKLKNRYRIHPPVVPSRLAGSHAARAQFIAGISAAHKSLLLFATISLTACVMPPPVNNADHATQSTNIDAFDQQQLYFVDHAECQYSIGAYGKLISVSSANYTQCMKQRGWSNPPASQPAPRPPQNQEQALQQVEIFFASHPQYVGEQQALYHEFDQATQDLRYRDLDMYQMLLLAAKRLTAQQK